MHSIQLLWSANALWAKRDMTLEEALAKIAELAGDIEAIKANNVKLIAEKRVLAAKAKGAEIDPEEHANLLTQVEALGEQLKTTAKSKDTEVSALKKSLTEKDGALSSLLIDGGISDTLAKKGVAAHYVDALKALFKGQAAVAATDKGHEARIGDKPLQDVIGEYLASDSGKHFVSAPNSAGGGASGGGSKTGAKKFADMNSDERVALYRSDKTAYEAAKNAA